MARPCACGHSWADHREIGCMGKDEDSEFCPCHIYEETPRPEPDEDSYPERER